MNGANGPARLPLASLHCPHLPATTAYHSGSLRLCLAPHGRAYSQPQAEEIQICVATALPIWQQNLFFLANCSGAFGHNRRLPACFACFLACSSFRAMWKQRRGAKTFCWREIEDGPLQRPYTVRPVWTTPTQARTKAARGEPSVPSAAFPAPRSLPPPLLQLL